MTGPHGPPGLPISMTSRVFEERTAKGSMFHYDGASNGSVWRSDTLDYFISRCPDGMPWLAWAEEKGAVPITKEAMELQKTVIMGEMDPVVFSHHVWGFLQLCLSGSARMTFKSADKRDGLNVWRELVLEINSRTACRRHGLRDKVQMQPQVSSNDQIKAALANWETLYNEYRAAGGEVMDFEDRRSQLLRILPSDFRKDLL